MPSASVSSETTVDTVSAPAQGVGSFHAHNSLLAESGQDVPLSISPVVYDEQIGLTFNESFASMAYNVTAVAQNDTYGYGPAYLLNGLSNDGYWYQVGLAYDWPYTYKGFYFVYEVFNSTGSPVLPVGGGAGLKSFSGPVNANDLVSLNLYFNNGVVFMNATDWNTSAIASQTYADNQTTSFIGLPSYGDSNGFFTGPMTEWWHVNPYYGAELQVTYSDNSLAKSSAFMWMDEWAPSIPFWSGRWGIGSGLLSYVSNPTKFYSLSYNGANEYSNAYYFITGPPPEVAPAVSASPDNIVQGQTSSLNSSAMATGVSPYTYQWFGKAPGGSYVAVGSNSASFNFVTSGSTVPGNWSFILQVSDTVGAVVNSSAAYVMVNAPLSFLVVRGGNNIVYYRTFNSSSAVWGPWAALPGSTIDSPAAAYADRLYVVVRGSDGSSLWFNSVNVTDNSVSGWALLGGSTPSTPVLTSNGTTLALVVMGSDNRIYYRFYNITSQAWTGWSALPSGSTLDGPAAALVGSTLHVVVKGSDGNSLWYCNVNQTSGVFSNWSMLSGSSPAIPTLTTNGTALALVVRGGDSRIYYRYYLVASQTWTGWTALPSGTTPQSPAATMLQNKLYINVVGSDTTSLWQSSIDMSTNTMSSWTPLSGSTPSKPTLTS